MVERQGNRGIPRDSALDAVYDRANVHRVRIRIALIARRMFDNQWAYPVAVARMPARRKAGIPDVHPAAGNILAGVAAVDDAGDGMHVADNRRADVDTLGSNDMDRSDHKGHSYAVVAAAYHSQNARFCCASFAIAPRHVALPMTGVTSYLLAADEAQQKRAF